MFNVRKDEEPPMCSFLVITVRSRSKVSHLKSQRAETASHNMYVTSRYNKYPRIPCFTHLQPDPPSWPHSCQGRPSTLDGNEVPANPLHLQWPASVVHQWCENRQGSPQRLYWWWVQEDQCCKSMQHALIRKSGIYIYSKYILNKYISKKEHCRNSLAIRVA